MSREMHTEPRLSRVEVIGPSGRILIARPCEATISLQDEGRTLKVFLDREPVLWTPEERQPDTRRCTYWCNDCGRRVESVGPLQQPVLCADHSPLPYRRTS